MIVDLFLVYQFIRRLATPFSEWEACKLGIIDDEGNILKSRRSLDRSEERSAFGIYDIMILKLKRLLAKVPGGSSRIASYAAALYLIKEWNHFSGESLLSENTSEARIDRAMDTFLEIYLKKFIDEDAPTNAVSQGATAGLGGINGEPGFTRKIQSKYKKRNVTEAETLGDMLAAEPGEGGMIGSKEDHPKRRRNKKHVRPAIELT